MTACLFVDHNVIVPGRHVSLLMGKVILERDWPKIVQWIGKSTLTPVQEMQQIKLCTTRSGHVRKRARKRRISCIATSPIAGSARSWDSLMDSSRSGVMSRFTNTWIVRRDSPLGMRQVLRWPLQH